MKARIKDQMMQDAPPPPPTIDCGKHAFFLDFDGTLAEIVARPEEAQITAHMRDLIGRLVDRTDGAVAVVSGRSLADVDRLMSPLVLPVAGSHGSELRGYDGAQQTDTDRKIDPDALQRITGFARQTGLQAEQKPGSAALHYRSAPDRAQDSIALIDDLAATDDRYRAVHGKMVSELALCAHDKGTALAHFANSAPFAGRVPVMVGDDVTDEDGFRRAQALGGLGIKIGAGETIAAHRLNSIGAFSRWLEDIIR